VEWMAWEETVKTRQNPAAYMQGKIKEPPTMRKQASSRAETAKGVRMMSM